MILLYNAQNHLVGSYKGFEDLCDYFRRLEYFKDHPPSAALSSQNSFPEGPWNFIYHPHKRLSALFGCLKEKDFNEQEHEAYGNDFDLIEIYTGSPNPRQIVLTPDIDILGIMRDWCFGYSYANNYVLLEVIGGGLDSERPEEHVFKGFGHQSFLDHDFCKTVGSMPHKFYRDDP